jgi:tetratricopeptide (TPR) repeat protein
MRLKVLLFLFLTSNMLLLGATRRSQRYKPIRKAENLILREKYACASKSLEEALMKDTNNEYIHYRLGYSYFRNNDFEKAVVHYEAATKLMKDSMKYQFEMYHLYSSVGLMSFAKEAFIKYINLCPSCIKADLLPGLTSNKLMYRKPIKVAKLMGYEGDRAESYPYIVDDKRIQHLEVNYKKGQTSHANQYINYLTTHFSSKDFLFYNSEGFTKKNKPSGDKFGPFSLNDSLNKIYITRLYIVLQERVDRARIGNPIKNWK